MELLDIYNNTGEKLGYTKTREEAHKEGYWHKIACVFVVNDEGKVIMQKRSALKLSNPNGWTCSASGHLDAGEDEYVGALRELKEEIGVKADKEELKFIGTAYENYNSNGMKIAHISNVYILYKNININDLVLQEAEVSDAKYYSISEIEESDFAKKHTGIFNILKKEIEKNNK